MKTTARNSATHKDDMRAEYDLKHMTGGVRAKYFKAYRAGHQVRIRKRKGTTVVRHFKLEDGAVMLEPDILKYFRDSEAVNNALRCLIPLFQRRRKAAAKT